MATGVYGIFDSTSNECLYVGQAKDIEVRWSGHIKKLKQGKHLRAGFNDWFTEHNFDVSFLDFRILEECENDDRTKNLLEIKWFNLLQPKFYGKRPSVNKKWEHSDETRKKIKNGMLNANSYKHITRICPICSTHFDCIKSTLRKYCSKECAHAADKQRRPSKQLVKECAICHKFFKSKNLTCSPKCSKELRRQIAANNARAIEISAEELQVLYTDNGLSLSEIAKIKGCNRQTIYTKMVKYGIPRRSNIS